MENLRVQVVMVICDVFLRFPQQYHDVYPLLYLLTREIGSQHINVQLVLTQYSNVFVGSVVMRPKGIHLIKDLT